MASTAFLITLLGPDVQQTPGQNYDLPSRLSLRSITKGPSLGSCGTQLKLSYQQHNPKHAGKHHASVPCHETLGPQVTNLSIALDDLPKFAAAAARGCQRARAQALDDRVPCEKIMRF